MSKINKEKGSYEIFCIHKQNLFNQGIWWCNIGLDIDHCDESCPGRHPKTVNYEISSTSINE